MPLHLVVRSRVGAEPLQAALPSVPAAGVGLPDSLSTLPLAWLPQFLSAMWDSSAAFTAVHSPPVVEPPETPALTLTVFTRLRALSLPETLDPPEVLRATRLPTSVQELTLVRYPSCYQTLGKRLPSFVDLNRLPNLRRITAVNHCIWKLSTWDDELQQAGPLRVPPSLEVCTFFSSQSCAT